MCLNISGLHPGIIIVLTNCLHKCYTCIYIWFYRLMEGFQDLPIQLKDLYQKQELEKEPVDVVIDEDKDDVMVVESESAAIAAQHDDRQQPDTADANKTPPTTINEGVAEDKPVPTSENKSDHSVLPSTSATASSGITTSTSSKLDMLMKPPNGFKPPVGSLNASGITEKLKPPTLPAFDAVKSPQPQIGRDDLSNNNSGDSGSRKKDTSSEGSTVVIPETHRNLNTLVDVAAKMKPVLNEAQPSNKSKAIGSSKGFSSISENNEKLPVDNISQHQLKDSNKAATKEERSLGGASKHHSDESLPNMLPFSVEGSSSPDRQLNEKEDKNNLSKKPSSGSSFPPPPSSSSKQVTTHSWAPPPPVQENIKDRRGSPTTNISSSVLNKPPRTVTGGGDHHIPPQQMPLSFHPPSSSSTVIQKKRKRVSPQTSEISKRPSPPIKERDNSPLSSGGPPQSLFVPPRPFDHPALLHGSIPPDKHLMKPLEQVGPPHAPPGFMYDPSIPMSYDLQVVSYTREKQAEANRNPDRNTPPIKMQKRQHPSFEMLNSAEPSSSTSRSPPYIASTLPGSLSKRSLSTTTSTSNSGGHSGNNKISPGVVMQTPEGTRHPSMIQQSPIKQEMHHPMVNRPARPSSKGSGASVSHVPSGKTSSSHSRKGNPSRRMENPSPSTGPIIKQEPPDHSHPQSHHLLSGPPPGHLPYSALHQAAFVMNPSSGMPPVVQQPQFTQSTGQPWGGVISNSSSSSQAHKRPPSDNLTIQRGSNSTRTPSPAPSKKSTEWQSAHPSIPPPHQQSIKHESMSNRHSNVGGDRHNNVSTHGSSSSSSSSSSGSRHHANKHDLPSSRHVIAAGQPHPIQIPATIHAGAAQTLSPTSYIAGIIHVHLCKLIQCMYAHVCHVIDK